MPDSDAYGAESAPFYFALLILVLMGATPRAWCHSPEPGVPCEFAQTIYSNFDFPEVELISRNHNIGLYRGGPIALNPRLEIESGVFLGIDRAGRLMQVLQLRKEDGSIDRVIGYVLSGEQVMQDFFVLPPGNLISISESGQIFRFAWPEWYRGQLDDARKRRWVLGTAAACLSTVGAGATAFALGVSPLSTPILVEFLGLQVVAAGLQGYLWSLSFEVDNIRTSGLQLINEIKGYRRSELRRGPDGTIVDYILHSTKGQFSLRDLVESGNGWVSLDQNFQRRCEHDLLARGIPPSNFE